MSFQPWELIQDIGQGAGRGGGLEREKQGGWGVSWGFTRHLSDVICSPLLHPCDLQLAFQVGVDRVVTVLSCVSQESPSFYSKAIVLIGANFAPPPAPSRGHLAMSGGIFGHHDVEEG